MIEFGADSEPISPAEAAPFPVLQLNAPTIYSRLSK